MVKIHRFVLIFIMCELQPKVYIYLILGGIFSKSADEISVINESSNGTHVSTNCVKFKTTKAISKELSYLIGDNKSVEDIRQQFVSRQMSDPLPPLPKLNPPTPLPRDSSGSECSEMSEHSIYVHNDCGPTPKLNEAPFWIVERNDSRTSSIYGNLPGFKDELLHHEHRRLEICNREPKRRFKMFVKAVTIKPAMLKVVEEAEKPKERLYDIPRVSVLVPETDIPANEFPQDNVESTFASFLRKIVRNTFNPELDACPLGLTRSERDKFCWRLDLIEYDIVRGPGWKDFANFVMQLDNDDLEMIDEFSCKYKCQVVEVVLDHWHKLHKMKSQKCLQPACKTTIIKVLNKMDKVSLLQELHWEHEVC